MADPRKVVRRFDLTIRIKQLVGVGDLVAVHATGRATHAGTFQGVPPSGKTWTARVPSSTG